MLIAFVTVAFADVTCAPTKPTIDVVSPELATVFASQTSPTAMPALASVAKLSAATNTT
ncbi:hypothetical protein [Psychrobacter sp. UBA3962]|uniref:hypothetical protein n=1 Tax=Psychrobacter sp. UBA3962 TaxID=1947352 RepID=UPI0025FE24D0|nr:hypothetical protein [Psychrobacter sp. UBA3962]